MGSKSSKSSSKLKPMPLANVQVQQENVEAGGLHIVEFNMPTLGMSFTTFALIILAIGVIYLCCKCCQARVAAAAMGPTTVAAQAVSGLEITANHFKTLQNKPNGDQANQNVQPSIYLYLQAATTTQLITITIHTISHYTHTIFPHITSHGEN